MTRRGNPLTAIRPPSPSALTLAAALAALLAGSLVATAMAGAAAATAWRAAARTATVVVPDGSPADAVATVLATLPASTRVRRLDPADLSRLLALPAPTPPPTLPAAFALHPAAGAPLPADLATRLASAAPGTLLETTDPAPFDRAAAWARAVRFGALALLPLLAIAFAARIAAATRTALGASDHAITLLHDLGAPDRPIGARFHRRAIAATACGALLGTLAPAALLLLSARVSPFPLGSPIAAPALLAAVPLTLTAIAAPASLLTVRSFLRRLP